MSLLKQMDVFHAHLDECLQCKNHPFALCPKGEALLFATADTLPPPDPNGTSADDHRKEDGLQGKA